MIIYAFIYEHQYIGQTESAGRAHNVPALQMIKRKQRKSENI